MADLDDIFGNLATSLLKNKGKYLRIFILADDIYENTNVYVHTTPPLEKRKSRRTVDTRIVVIRYTLPFI